MPSRSHQKSLITRERQKSSRGAADARLRPITCLVLANGVAIEPLRDNTNADRLSLLFWDGKKATIHSKITYGDQSFEPAPIEPTLLKALTLPRRVVSCASPRGLLTDIAKLTTEYTGFAENSVAALSRWQLSTWFPEMRPAPGLALVGPDTTAARQQFELLNCLCRRPLLLTEVSAARLLTLPMEWDFTLLIRQPELSVEVQRILSTARRGIGLIPRGGRVLDFHCCVATHTEFGNTSASGVMPMLEISTFSSRQNLPVLDNAIRHKIANDFQPRLLGYRLANYAKVLNSAFDAPELAPSTRELAKNLSACTPDDPDLQAQVPEFLRRQDQDIRSAIWLEINTAVIETVLAFLHEGKQNCIYVREIAKASEEILSRRGENLHLEPRAIGARLGILGLITEPRDSKGVRLVLTEQVSRHVHELASYLSVPSILNGARGCPHCGKAEAPMKGRQVRTGV
jgi:hypothetical protein